MSRIAEALGEGYSYAEITAFLSNDKRVSAAKEEGYSDEDIVNFLRANESALDLKAKAEKDTPIIGGLLSQAEKKPSLIEGITGTEIKDSPRVVPTYTDTLKSTDAAAKAVPNAPITPTNTFADASRQTVTAQEIAKQGVKQDNAGKLRALESTRIDAPAEIDKPFLRGLGSATGDMIAGTVGAFGQVLDATGFGTPESVTKVYQNLKSRADSIRPEDVSKMGEMDQALYYMGSGLAYSAGSILAIAQPELVLPYLGFMGTTASGNKYQSLIEKGVSKPEAQANALITGTSEALTEMLGIKGGHRVMQYYAKLPLEARRQFTKRLLLGTGVMVMGAAEEGTEELINKQVENATDILTGAFMQQTERGNQKTAGKLASTRIAEGSGEAFKGGAYGGLLFGAGGAFVADQQTVKPNSTTEVILDQMGQQIDGTTFVNDGTDIALGRMAPENAQFTQTPAAPSVTNQSMGNELLDMERTAPRTPTVADIMAPEASVDDAITAAQEMVSAPTDTETSDMVKQAMDNISQLTDGDVITGDDGTEFTFQQTGPGEMPRLLDADGTPLPDELAAPLLSSTDALQGALARRVAGDAGVQGLTADTAMWLGAEDVAGYLQDKTATEKESLLAEIRRRDASHADDIQSLLPAQTPDTAPAPKTDGSSEVVGANGMRIVHGSGNANLTADDIQIVRQGQKQGKKGRSYGGLYGASETDLAQAEEYAAMMGGTPTVYDITIQPGTRVLHKEGDITRLSENYINDLVAQGYGLVTGRNMRGRNEYVVIDRNAVAAMQPRSTTTNTTNPAGEPVAPQPTQPVTQESQTQSPQVASEGVVKEPWQMTRDEYVRGDGFDLSPHAKLTGLKESPWQADDVSRATMTHKFQHILPAIEAGKTIPPEVLAEYPDLQARAVTPAAPAVVVTPAQQKVVDAVNASLVYEQAKLGDKAPPLQQLTVATPEQVTPAVQEALPLAQAFLEAAGYQHEMVVVAPTDDKTLDFDGAVASNGAGIVIAADSARTVPRVVVHEFGHEMRKEAPQVWETLAAEILGRTDKAAQLAHLKKRGYAGETLTPPMAEEFVNDVLSDMLNSGKEGPRILVDVASNMDKAEPGSGKEFLKRLLEFIDKVIKGMVGKGYGTEATILKGEVGAIRKAIAKALTDYNLQAKKAEKAKAAAEAAKAKQEAEAAKKAALAAEVARAKAKPAADEMTEDARAKLLERKQMLEDMIATKKEMRQVVPQHYITGLAEVSAKLRGETVDTEAIYSNEVEGHPMFDGSPILRNLIPIKVVNVESAEKSLYRAQDLYKQIAGERAKANHALSIAKTAAQKKSAETALKKLDNIGATQDALDTLREVTLPELARLLKEADAKFGPVEVSDAGGAKTDVFVGAPQAFLNRINKAVTNNVPLLVMRGSHVSGAEYTLYEPGNRSHLSADWKTLQGEDSGSDAVKVAMRYREKADIVYATPAAEAQMAEQAQAMADEKAKLDGERKAREDKANADADARQHLTDALAGAKFTKGEFTPVSDKPGAKLDPVSGMVHGGLIVHKSPGHFLKGQQYTISHVATGMAVLHGFKSQPSAKQAAARLSRLADMTKLTKKEDIQTKPFETFTEVAKAIKKNDGDPLAEPQIDAPTDDKPTGTDGPKRKKSEVKRSLRNTFVSQLAYAFDSAKQNAMPGSQWAAWVNANKSNYGLKADEIQWSGITDYLALRGKDKVTKAEIADYLSGNGVKVDSAVNFRGENGEDSYIVFNPTQIKSAIGNDGGFDGTNPDIRRSRRESPEYRRAQAAGLDTSPAAVDVRRKEQGWSDTIYYHGTRVDVDMLKGGLISLTENSSTAEEYASGGGGNRKNATQLWVSLDDNGDAVEVFEPDYDEGVYVGNLGTVIDEDQWRDMRGNGEIDSVRTGANIIPVRIRGKLLDLHHHGYDRNGIETNTQIKDVLGSLDPRGNRFASAIVSNAKKGDFDWGATKYQPHLAAWKDVLNPQLEALGYSGLSYHDDGHSTVAMFSAKNIRSTNAMYNPEFDEGSRLLFSKRVPLQHYGVPKTWGNGGTVMTPMDSAVYTLQDRHIELKRAVQEIRATGAQLDDKWDPYLTEELFHGRAASRAQEFIKSELEPLTKDLLGAGISIAELDDYLWARHAINRNEEMEKINPEQVDANGDRNGSGLTDAEAQAKLDALTPAQQAQLESFALRVDDMNAETRRLMVEYGLETQDTIDLWEGKYPTYVPLMRDVEDEGGVGSGAGYSTGGKTSKRAMGSDRPVENILANIANQRDKVINKGEKNRVAMAVYGAALLNPNPDFWGAVNPLKINDNTPANIAAIEKARLRQELTALGLPAASINNMVDRPTEKSIHPITGMVVRSVNPLYMTADNILSVRVNGEDRFVVFNPTSEKAVRAIAALKNLDVTDRTYADPVVERTMHAIGATTRYFAKVNTQYNPVFGAVNFARDVQGALLNLQSTELKGQQKEVLKDVYRLMKDAAKHGFRMEKLDPADLVLWKQMLLEGGTTGYRDLFKDGKERNEAIVNALDPKNWQGTKWGKVLTANGYLASTEQLLLDKGNGIVKLLSDYNETMENVVRLAVFKAAIDHGLSGAKAASLSKNITTNFNRRGSIGQQAGQLFAFFNAAVQGTARIGETLIDRKPDGKYRISEAGKAIVSGGLIVGMLQPLLLALAGYGDDEPPEFVRDRNLIIPYGPKSLGLGYATIPMPLGYHVIPGMTRIPMEAIMQGKAPKDVLWRMMGLFMEAFNPLGGSSSLTLMVSPTVTDPFFSLDLNKDWNGRPIYQESFSDLNESPGHTRAKDNSTGLGYGISYAINWLSGGDKYQAGEWSPTPDAVEYMIGQLTGGVGREVMKAWRSGKALATGEAVPTHQIPLVSRFYGRSDGKSGEGPKFYTNLKYFNELRREKLERIAKKDDVSGFKMKNPDHVLIDAVMDARRDVNKLRKHKAELVEKGASRERIRLIDDKITGRMARINKKIEDRRDRMED